MTYCRRIMFAFTLYASLRQILGETEVGKGENIPFTEEDIDVVLYSHNSMRSQNMTPPACNMKEITWDDNLAKFAQSHSEKCIYKYMDDTSSDLWSAAGQGFLLAAAPWGTDFHYSAVLKSINEGSVYTYENSSCSAFCSQYAQVAYSETTKVGCAATVCPEVDTGAEKIDNATLYICMYLPKVPDLDGSFKLYRTGTEDCSGSFLDDWSMLEKAIAGACAGAAMLGLMGTILKMILPSCKRSPVEPSSPSDPVENQEATNGKAPTSPPEEP